MYINFYIYPLILILAVILGLNINSNKRKIFIVLASTILLFQTTFRSLSVGSDTKNYYFKFLEAKEMSWQEVWQNVLGRYLYLENDQDAGYLFFQKIIASFTDSWFLFVFIANLIFFIPLGILIYRYSTSMLQMVFAYILYIALFHVVSLSGGRQLYALGLSISAFLYMDKGKYKKSLICIGIGVLFHFSCLITVLPLLLRKFNAKSLKIIHLISLFLVPLVISNANTIISFMGNTISIDRYANYGSQDTRGGVTVFISILILTSIFCYIGLKEKYLKQSRSAINFYTMLPLFTFFGPLIYSNGSMIRISMYFHIFLIILIPLAVAKVFKMKDRILFLIIFIIVLIFMSLRDGGLLYYFYWQQPHLFNSF